MINVQQNKSTVFFSALINKLLNKKEYKKHLLHLGKRIFQYFDGINEIPLAKEFIKEYKTDIPLKIYFEYIQLSLYLNKDFEFSFDEEEEKLLNSSEVYKRHVEIIKTIVKEIYDELQFEEFYKNEIKEEYGNLCKKLQQLFENKPEVEGVLREFWKISITPFLVFIPNIVSLGDCFGVRRGDSFYSISSGKIDKETKISEYTSTHVYSNAIHEFSHQFFKEQINELHLGKEVERVSKEKFKLVDLKKDVVEAYQHNYFEECFIKASTIRIEELANISNLDNIQLKKRVDKILSWQGSSGYIHVPVFYNALINRQNEYISESFLEELNQIS